MIPINYGHDYTRPSIGKMVERDGKQMLVFNKGANISVDSINSINGRIAPTYIITKEKDGIVLECELVSFAVVPKPKGEL